MEKDVTKTAKWPLSNLEWDAEISSPRTTIFPLRFHDFQRDIQLSDYYKFNCKKCPADWTEKNTTLCQLVSFFIKLIPTNFFLIEIRCNFCRRRICFHFHNYHSSKIMGCCSRNGTIQNSGKEKNCLKSVFKMSGILTCLVFCQLFFNVSEGKAVSRTGCSHQTNCVTCTDINIKIPILAVSKALLNINGDIYALDKYFPTEQNSRESLSEVRRIVRVSK